MYPSGRTRMSVRVSGCSLRCKRPSVSSHTGTRVSIAPGGAASAFRMRWAERVSENAAAASAAIDSSWEVAAGTWNGTQFVVQSSHTYAQEGYYPITVKIVDTDGASATVISNAIVSHAALTAPVGESRRFAAG